ncbi:MAG: hypothetical protein K2I81_04260, partial [Alphaproteobacteria bacterium]|nr:hypothetical protein [Alphaproteobacteria bacterium]
VYSKDGRKKLRVVLNSPMLEYFRFIRADTGLKMPRLRTFVGYQARSLIIGVNNRWVYKFPLRRDNYRELAMREQRIIKALSPISSIPVPGVKLIEYKGMLVRKYDFITGATLRSAPRDLIMKNLQPLAASVAQFLYGLARVDPAEIRDLKPSPDARPGYMYGWCQGDVCDNFMIDLKTMKIKAFIDWEDARFCDFSYMFCCEKRSPAREFMSAVRIEYDRLWNANNKS